MNLSILIGALRAGHELPNPTNVKWAGLAVTGLSLVLSLLSSVAFSHGWLSDSVSPSEIYELSGLLVTASFTVLGYIQVATTKKIGITKADSDG